MDTADPAVTTKTPWPVAAVPKEISAEPPEAGVALTTYSQVAPAIGYGTDWPVMTLTVVRVKSHCWSEPRGMVSAHGCTDEELATRSPPHGKLAISSPEPDGAGVTSASTHRVCPPVPPEVAG